VRQKEILVGIVGANAKVSHVPAINGLPGLKLAAVATSNEQSAREAAEALGADRWFSDPLAMIRDDRIDLITIFVKDTRTPRARPGGIECWQGGVLRGASQLTSRIIGVSMFSASYFASVAQCGCSGRATACSEGASSRDSTGADATASWHKISRRILTQGLSDPGKPRYCITILPCLGICEVEIMAYTARRTHHEIQGVFATTEGLATYTPFVVVRILSSAGNDCRVECREYLESGTKTTRNQGIRPRLVGS
jgi:hypothetical protein